MYNPQNLYKVQNEAFDILGLVLDFITFPKARPIERTSKLNYILTLL